MKISNDNIGNRTRDLPVCSAVQRRISSSGKLEVGALIAIEK